MAEEGFRRKLTAILSADVEGYSRLMGDDEEATIRTLTKYRNAMTNLIQKYRGRLVDTIGDNLLAEFVSVVDAVNCAVEIQREFAERNADLPYSRKMEFRIGVNLGDVVEEEGRIYGDGVNIAARVESLAEAGGICISGRAYDQVENKLGLEYENLGEHEVKNITRPIRVYRVLSFPGAAAHRVVQAKETVGKRWRKLALVAVTIVVVGTIAGGVWNFYFRSSLPPVEAASVENMAYPLPEKPSIVILPFVNMSGDPEQDSFCDWITDGIITQLYKIPEVFVIAKNSAFSYKGKSVKIRQVSEELGVRYVLEGSVNKSGDRIRINVQLIDALSGDHMWAEIYDRPLKNVFEVQDEITRMVVTELAVKISYGEGWRSEFRASDNFQAIDYYIKADKIFMRFEQESNNRARQLLQKAVELDPNYSRAIAFLGWTHIIDARDGWVKDPSRSLKLAEELGDKAVAINNKDYLAYTLLARIYLGKRLYEKAIATAEKAVQVEPSNAMSVYLLGETLTFSGRPVEGLVELKKSIRMCPYPPSYLLMASGFANYLVGRHEAAIAEFLKYLKKQKHGSVSQILWQWMIASYMELGRVGDARAEGQKLLSEHPDLSLKKYNKAIKRIPFKDYTFLDRQIELLRKAGIPDKPPSELPDKPSIAVLPFTNMSGDPEQEYFSDGMTDDLITDLSKISGLFVIARNSTFQYKGQSVDVKKVSRELGVRYLLEGSVRRADDQVRINAQLIDATSGNHLWAERYDGKMNDIFALQDGITQKIVAALAVKLADSEQEQLARKETDSIAAYDAFLKGQRHFILFTPDDLRKAVLYMKKAIELDPNYGRALAVMGRIYWLTPSEWLEISWEHARLQARQYLEMAMKNPTPLAHILAADINLFLRLYKEAISEAEHSLAIAPNDPVIHSILSKVLNFAGRPKEAAKHAKLAIKYDPRFIHFSLFYLGLAHFGMGKYEQAATYYERSLKHNPGFYWVLPFLSATYSHLGHNKEAKGTLKNFLQKFPFLSTLRNLMQFVPFKDQEVADSYVYGILKAGLHGKSSWYYRVLAENRLSGGEIKKLLFGRSRTVDVLTIFEYKTTGELVSRDPTSWKTVYDKGTAWVEGDVLCHQWENKWYGLKDCSIVYRNPKGTRERKDEYLSITHHGIAPWSLVN